MGLMTIDRDLMTNAYVGLLEAHARLLLETGDKDQIEAHLESLIWVVPEPTLADLRKMLNLEHRERASRAKRAVFPSSEPRSPQEPDDALPAHRCSPQGASQT